MLPFRRLKVAILIAICFPAFTRPATETLRIQIGKDNAILDTVVLVIDPAKFPQVPHPDGADWADIEQDTAWTDSTGRHLRYNHSFAVSMDTVQGYGNDFIFLDQADSASSYSASVNFAFPRLNFLQYSWDSAHLQNDSAARPHAQTEFVTGYPKLGKVSRFSGDSNLTQGQWAKLLVREPGGILPVAILTRAGRAALGDGWLNDFTRGTALRLPPGAKAVRIFDVEGRLRWESGNLPEGALLALPANLPRKALRVQWR